jgi:hypothetical protein
MDPFEEFEFKPLTDGLGFHNRTKAAPPHVIPADFASTTIQTPLPRKTEEPLSDLRRPTTKPTTPANASNTTVDEILKTLGERKKYDFSEATALSQPTEQTQALYMSSRFELSAGILDGMLIIASYLAALIVVLLITKVDLFGNLLNPDPGGMIYFALLGLLASLTWIYLVVNRLFLGFTPGEWVFDQRLGQPRELGTASYSLKVAARSLLVLATGFVVIPLFSMISRRDILGKALGAELVKKA